MRKVFGTSVLALAAVLALSVPAQLAAKDEPKAAAAAEAPKIPPELLALEKGLHPQTGDVRIPEAKAVLHLGDRYYFLPAAEARRVLVEVWRNPPDAVSDVLGLVLEKDTTIFKNVWGAVITYRDSGHVSDADAGSQDYAQVLTDMQQGEAEDNRQRKAAGYPTMQLVGWAQAPSYDQGSHALIWARELASEGMQVNSLNYDVRLLGRTGVLSLNMVSDMSAIGDVRTAAQAFGKAVTFEPGAAYADYNASTDKTAEYGLAGLVAGGAAVAVAKKIGLLGLILAFGKKFIVLIGIGIAALVGAVGKMMGRNKEEDVI